MDVLVVAELLDGGLRKNTLSAVAFAKQVAEGTDGEFDVLAIGEGAEAAGEELDGYGARTIYTAEIEGGYFAEKYAPKNGGYCTFGVVLKKKFDGDPNVWHVKDDSLYVFLNDEVKKKFLADEKGNLEKVTANWPEIKDTPKEELGE